MITLYDTYKESYNDDELDQHQIELRAEGYAREDMREQGYVTFDKLYALDRVGFVQDGVKLDLQWYLDIHESTPEFVAEYDRGYVTANHTIQANYTLHASPELIEKYIGVISPADADLTSFLYPARDQQTIDFDTETGELYTSISEDWRESWIYDEERLDHVTTVEQAYDCLNMEMWLERYGSRAYKESISEDFDGWGLLYCMIYSMTYSTVPLSGRLQNGLDLRQVMNNTKSIIKDNMPSKRSMVSRDSFRQICTQHEDLNNMMAGIPLYRMLTMSDGDQRAADTLLSF